MTDYKKWQTTASRYIVNDRWLKLRADTCVTPDRHTIDPWYVFEYGDWLTCLVIDDESNVIAARHYRYAANEYVLEIVSAYIDDTDPSPEAAARREAAEELGYTGGTIYKTGVSYANPANHTNKIHHFMAVGGACNQKQALGAAEQIHIEKIPLLAFLERMGTSGAQEVSQSFHLANLFLAMQYIQTSKYTQLQKLRKIIQQQAANSS